MQSEYEKEQLQEEIPYPNIITFQDWNTIKQYGNITKGTTGFIPEDLDEAVVFFDEKMEYIDYLERKKVEDIIPVFVMLPRFFWEDRRETMPEDFLPELRIPDRLKLLSTEREYWTNLENRSLAGVETLPIKDGVKPRPEQEPALDFLLDRMQTNRTIRGILQAAPGVGKTIMTIMTLARYKAKSIIIVPNTVLLDQWIEAILEFTELKEEDIGIIQGSDLSKMKIDKPISIVKIQSLFSQIKHNHIHHLQQFYRSIDVAVFDEAHNSGGATSYSKTSSIFLTPNILGLTATPYRTKINEFMLRTSVGDTIYKVEHQNLVPDIEIHNVWTEFTPKENSRLMGAKADYVMFLGVFNSLMKTKNDYFSYLADVVYWDLSQGHNIVVLFPTIAMQELLLANIESKYPGITHKVLLLKGKTKQDSMEMVKGERKLIMAEFKEYKTSLDAEVKSKSIKRKEANELIKDRRETINEKIDFLKEHALDLYKSRIKKATVIVSNYNLLSAGFDKSEMSNLILGGAPRIGKISVIQSIGRITRIHEGKKQPLVQYFIPSKFIEMQKSTSIILTRNIRVQYPEAKFKYIGFKESS